MILWSSGGSRGLMVFWLLSWSFGLLATSHGQVKASFPQGSHGLMVSWSHGLLVALVVTWCSGGSRSLMVFWWLSWSLGLIAASHGHVKAPLPLGFSLEF